MSEGAVWTGTLDRVGADHAELADPCRRGAAPGRVGRSRSCCSPVAAISLVRSLR